MLSLVLQTEQTGLQLLFLTLVAYFTAFRQSE
jgi:hypothetical protein